MDHGEIEHGSQPGRRGGLARPRHSVEQDAAGGAEILHGGGGHASRLPEVSLSADSTFSHDCPARVLSGERAGREWAGPVSRRASIPSDRKSTRLNSSHVAISYAVFCSKTKTVDQFNIPYEGEQ